MLDQITGFLSEYWFSAACVASLLLASAILVHRELRQKKQFVFMGMGCLGIVMVVFYLLGAFSFLLSIVGWFLRH